MTDGNSHRRTVWIVLALVALVVSVYAGVVANGFVDFDDGAYVFENANVMDGLTLEGIGWAFTTGHSANWHPLTWISHMLDVELFDLEAGWHHAVSVLLHAANTALLFVLLQSMTRAAWRSAFVAAAFAVHPLHVESVAWIAERKDVLSTLFLLLTCLAYVRYVRAPTTKSYVLVAVLYALGLMSKPMLVTLPALLVLLDLWPLQRWSLRLTDPVARRAALLDKLPLLGLAVASSLATVLAQSGAGATGTLEAYPFGARLANAAVAYLVYLQKTLWPTGLACFYPHPSTLGQGVDSVALGVALLALAAISALVLRQLYSKPHLAVGWLWYLGTLVPVIGLIQVGSQAFADRYTYVPLIGVFVMLAWSVPERFASRASGRWTLGVAAALVLSAWSALSWIQVGTWRDGETLYRHAVAVTESNWLAWNNLGNQSLGKAESIAEDDARRVAEIRRALDCFEQAQRARPDYADAWFNAGQARLQLLDRERAVADYRRSLELDERNVDGWSSLGMALLNLGRYEEAVEACNRALALEPRHANALDNLAFSCALKGDKQGFEFAMQRLRAINPALEAEVNAQLRAVK